MILVTLEKWAQMKHRILVFIGNLVGTCFDACWQRRMSSFGISSSAASSSVESRGGESSTSSGNDHKMTLARPRDVGVLRHV